MAHFAKINLDTNIVLEINVVTNSNIQELSFPESEPIGIEYLTPWNTPNTYWKYLRFNKRCFYSSKTISFLGFR